MASERMMQAIGTLERAVSRLELEVSQYPATSSPSSHGIDVTAARSALRSLDALIADMKGNGHG